MAGGVVILGDSACGKTTLARTALKRSACRHTFFSASDTTSLKSFLITLWESLFAVNRLPNPVCSHCGPATAPPSSDASESDSDEPDVGQQIAAAAGQMTSITDFTLMLANAWTPSFKGCTYVVRNPSASECVCLFSSLCPFCVGGG